MQGLRWHDLARARHDGRSVYPETPEMAEEAVVTVRRTETWRTNSVEHTPLY